MSGIYGLNDYSYKLNDYSYNSYQDYSSRYETTGNDLSAFFNTTGQTSSTGNTFSLADYASIKNGSYGKLLKSYYAKLNADGVSQKGDSSQRLTLIKSGADALKKSADALKESSLWEKKKIKKKDEETGEETEVEDYDWEAITKAVKSFVDNYNDLVEETGESDTKNILRNAAWMTNLTDKTQSLLAKVGITIGKGNKLELDEDSLKEADISTLKSIFTGSYSFGDQISGRASSISNAAASTKSVSATNGTYAKSIVDEKI